MLLKHLTSQQYKIVEEAFFRDAEDGVTLKDWFYDAEQQDFYGKLFEPQKDVVPCVPYQLCPKCNGQGIVSNNYSSSVYDKCNVCHGSMIIPMCVVEPQPLLALQPEISPKEHSYTLLSEHVPNLGSKIAYRTFDGKCGTADIGQFPITLSDNPNGQVVDVRIYHCGDNVVGNIKEWRYI